MASVKGSFGPQRDHNPQGENYWFKSFFPGTRKTLVQGDLIYDDLPALLFWKAKVPCLTPSVPMTLFSWTLKSYSLSCGTSDVAYLGDMTCTLWPMW